MRIYIIKRFLMTIPVLIGATFLVFTIMHFAPGDPARIILGAGASEEALEAMRDQLGINDSFILRYGRFMLNLMKGDLGTSYRNGQPVTGLILGRLGNTLYLAISGILFAIIVGIPVGIISAIKQYSTLDNVTMFITLFVTAMPTFWLALILVIVFSVNLGWFPASGMAKGFPGFLVSLVLPTLTLGCGFAALIARTTRSSVLDVVRQEYIDLARAKGLPERTVIWKHMMKNALIPIITVIGLNFGVLLGGSVLTESIFSWPGVGRFVVESISFKDTPAILGCVVTLAILFTLVNLIVDLLYAFLDPRIKSQYRTSRGDN
ncbi:peptide ABC transporter permease [Synergistales bacterium]|nr:peptide ABC transporter permease [Synergistales bacterium]